MDLPLLIVVALFTGFVVGLIGVGGTLIVLPLLLFTLPELFPTAPVTKIAIATTLASITVSTASASLTHFRLGHVNLRIFFVLGAAYLITGIIGANIVGAATEATLKLTLGIVLILLALHLFRKQLRPPLPEQKKTTLALPPLTGVATFTGLINSICAIGAGNIMIPFLSRYFSYPVASGTSVSASSISCGAAAISYIFVGLNANDLPEHSIGYIYFPYFAVLAICMLITTPLGVRAQSLVSAKWLKVLLAVLVLSAGIDNVLGFLADRGQ